jgi:hypothetical protein
MKKKTQSSESQSTKASRIYVGPSVLGLKKHTIFRGDFPPNVQALIDKKPDLIHLFVSPDEVATAMKDMATPGHKLHYFLKKIQKEK